MKMSHVEKYAVRSKCNTIKQLPGLNIPEEHNKYNTTSKTQQVQHNKYNATSTTQQVERITD